MAQKLTALTMSEHDIMLVREHFHIVLSAVRPLGYFKKMPTAIEPVTI